MKRSSFMYVSYLHPVRKPSTMVCFCFRWIMACGTCMGVCGQAITHAVGRVWADRCIQQSVLEPVDLFMAVQVRKEKFSWPKANVLFHLADSKVWNAFCFAPYPGYAPIVLCLDKGKFLFSTSQHYCITHMLVTSNIWPHKVLTAFPHIWQFNACQACRNLEAYREMKHTKSDARISLYLPSELKVWLQCEEYF